MKRKHAYRRFVAGILAILTVTGNALLPSTIRIPFTPAAITASAVTQSGTCRQGQNSYNYTYDTDTGALTITSGTLWKRNSVLALPSGINRNSITSIVMKSGTSFPQDSNSMFSGMTGLTSFVAEDGVTVKTGGYGYCKMSSLFENCTSLTTVDLSGITNGDKVAYVDKMFHGCSALQSADLSSLSGEEIGDGWDTFFGTVNPVSQTTDGCAALTSLTLSPSFIYNALGNLSDSLSSEFSQMTAEEFVGDLLEGFPAADSLSQALLAQYYDY